MQPYLFAHRGVPHLFFQNPPEIMNILGRPDAHEFLEGAWALIGKECEPQDRAAFLDVTIEYEALEGDAFVVLIKLPAPRRTGEAYYAIPTARFVDGGAGQRAFARYFTVGRIDDALGNSHPVLLEWDQGGEYTDHGDLEDTSAETVLDALERALARPR